MKRSAKKPRYDYTMLTVIFLLVTIGLILLYSTSAYNGMVKFQDPYYYLKKQGFATALGLVGMFVVARVDYHTWVPLANVGYLTAVALSVAVMLVGDEYNGSKRWLSLGPVSFQPSEFAKVALILFLACLVTKNVKAMGKVSTLVKVMIPVLPIVALVGASNLSTAIISFGDCRSPDLCCESEVCTIYLDGRGGGWIYDDFFGIGKLSFGASCNLEKSGKI